MSVLICAHPWLLVQATQQVWRSDPPELLPAIYRCQVCGRTKTEGEPDVRTVLAILEEDPK